MVLYAQKEHVYIQENQTKHKINSNNKRILKATVLLLLYNIVEAVINKILVEIIENINILYDEYKEKGDKSLPAFLLYSRCFLSFSKVERVAKNFLGSNNDKAYAIFFVLKNNENVLNKYSSNADIENLSAFTSEKEVLFFPFTTFCVENIEDIDEKDNYENTIKKYVKVNMEYIGRYDIAPEKFQKNVNLKNEITEEFVDCFEEKNYSKELINANIIKSNKPNDNKDKISKKN